MTLQKLVLGTANIGSKYGIAKRGPVMSQIEAINLLTTAYSLGITSLDTSTNYLNVAQILRTISSNNMDFNYHLKFPSKILLNGKKATAEIKKFQDSIQAKNIYSISFHDSEYLLKENPINVHNTLQMISNMGFTKRLGLSVYSEMEILKTAQEYEEINFFQVPENILDRRLLTSSLIAELYLSGKEFQVRSIFLQGLILMEQIPKGFSLVLPHIKNLQKFAEQNSCTLLDLCLSYAKKIPWSSSIVIGVENIHQLKVISESFNNDYLIPAQESKIPLSILDPRNWENENDR